MLSPGGFRELVSGRRRGVGAAVARGLLRLAEVPYTAAVRLRNRRYDSGASLATRVEVPVVSVGNLTLGGTGKTPLVQWIARWLQGRGVPVTIISRGYGASVGGLNDEALELHENLPGVPHVLDRDRVAAAKRAIVETGCRLVLLDDAFQHRRLVRDLDLVLLDAMEPFGFGHVFPRGTLREPVDGLRRAGAIVLSRADMLRPDERAALGRQALAYAPGALWAEVTHRPQALRSADGRQEPIGSLAGQRLVAFCGLGNPAGFRRTLAQCGYQVCDFREFDDHYPYAPADVARLSAWAERLGATAAVCSHKDLVKLRETHLGVVPLWAVKVEMQFLDGQEAIEQRLAALASGTQETFGR